jgi:hypothetical protein
MNINTRFALILVLGLCVCGHLAAQKPADMAGTWSGMATLDGEAEPNELTLVLELAEGKLKGHMTDQYETLTESPLTEIKLEGAVFSFSVKAMGPGGEELPITFKMDVDVKEGAMKGILEIPDMGMSGTWEASKK